VLIGVDIDGVLYPWDECARDALVEQFGIERPGPSLDWDYLKNNVPSECWRWLWTAEGQDAAFGQTGRTYPHVADAVNAILRHGEHDVHFVTHRDPRRTAAWTAAFLTRHFGGHPWAGVHVTQASVAKRTLGRWDVFIDDKPETVCDFLHNTEAKVFTPARPWNQELNDVVLFQAAHGGDRFAFYDDPREVAEWVLSR
jgi:hypothetical protein